MVQLFAILLAIPIIWGIYRLATHKAVGDACGEWVSIIVPSIALFVLLLTTTIVLVNNANGLAQWEAFYDANSRNYEIAVDRTASYLSEQAFVERALIPVEGSIEKLEQGKYVSERIAEWRNKVNQYNTTIASMQYYDNNPIFGSLVPDEVQDMKLLIIE